MVALVVGGRHPGHYFLDSDDFNDVVTRLVASVISCHIPFCRTDVCPVKISPPGVVVRRAGATARWRMFNSNDEYRLSAAILIYSFRTFSLVGRV